MMDLDKLEQLARAATPGPWARDAINTTEIVSDAAMAVLARAFGRDDNPDGNADANAAFIAAANPAAVLELVQRLRAAEAVAARVQALRQVCPPWSPEAFKRLHDVYAAIREGMGWAEDYDPCKP